MSIAVLLTVVMSTVVACQQILPTPSASTAVEYRTYNGLQSGPHFSFEGPKEWSLRVHEPGQGDPCKYWSLTLYGPSRPRGISFPFLVVEAFAPKRDGGCVDSLDEILQNYQRAVGEHQRINSAEYTVINSAAALQIVMNGETRDFNEGVPVGEPYPSTNRITAIDGNGYIYEVHLAADPTEFEQHYARVYHRAVTTLKFGRK